MALGRAPKAFVALRAGREVSEHEIIAFCRERLAHFKCPDAVAFGPAPEDVDREGAEFRAARAGMGGAGAADQLTWRLPEHDDDDRGCVEVIVDDRPLRVRGAPSVSSTAGGLVCQQLGGVVVHYAARDLLGQAQRVELGE